MLIKNTMFIWILKTKIVKLWDVSNKTCRDWVETPTYRIDQPFGNVSVKNIKRRFHSLFLLKYVKQIFCHEHNPAPAARIVWTSKSIVYHHTMEQMILYCLLNRLLTIKRLRYHACNLFYIEVLCISQYRGKEVKQTFQILNFFYNHLDMMKVNIE